MLLEGTNQTVESAVEFPQQAVEYLILRENSNNVVEKYSKIHLGCQWCLNWYLRVFMVAIILWSQGNLVVTGNHVLNYPSTPINPEFVNYDPWPLDPGGPRFYVGPRSTVGPRSPV